MKELVYLAAGLIVIIYAYLSLLMVVALVRTMRGEMVSVQLNADEEVDKVVSEEIRICHGSTSKRA